MLEPKRWAIFMLLFLVACAFTLAGESDGMFRMRDCGPSSVLSTRPYCRSQSVACSSCSGNIARRGSQFEFGERA
jgi:hypothetical protein